MTTKGPSRKRHGAYNGWCRVEGIPLKAKDCAECRKVDAKGSSEVGR